MLWTLEGRDISNGTMLIDEHNTNALKVRSPFLWHRKWGENENYGGINGLNIPNYKV